MLDLHKFSSLFYTLAIFNNFCVASYYIIYSILIPSEIVLAPSFYSIIQSHQKNKPILDRLFIW